MDVERQLAALEARATAMLPDAYGNSVPTPLRLPPPSPFLSRPPNTTPFGPSMHNSAAAAAAAVPYALNVSHEPSLGVGGGALQAQLAVAVVAAGGGGKAVSAVSAPTTAGAGAGSSGRCAKASTKVHILPQKLVQKKYKC